MKVGRRSALVGLMLAASLLPQAALAAQEQRLVAVLPLNVRGNALDETSREILEESIRTIAGDVLSPHGYTVLTGDNTLRLLADNGIDANRACEASCALDAARELKASLFVSGTVAKTEGVLVVFVRLFEEARGMQLSSIQLDGRSVLEVRSKLADAAGTFFGKAMEATRARAAQVEAAPKAPARVSVSFESDPPGAAVVVDGAEVCPATPCTREVLAGLREISMKKERYEDAQLRQQLSAGGRVSLPLVPKFAHLAIETQPPGLSVRLDGKPVGRTPLAARELTPGVHEVVIDDPCFLAEGERVVLKPGDSRVVRLAPGERLAGLRLSAVDSGGRAAEGEIEVDGRILGRTPAVLRVPVCSRKLVVRASWGTQWSAELVLKDREVREWVAKLPGQDSVALKAEAPPPEQPAPPAETSGEEAPVDPGSTRRFALRAGLSPHNGVLGVAGELRLGPVGLLLGTGTHLLGGGLSFGSPSNSGGFYVDLHAVLVEPGVLGGTLAGGVGFGGTVGWDLRLVPWLSVKAGLGAAFSTSRPAGGIPLVYEFSVGPVF